MPNLETAIRLVVIGQEVLIAAIFLFGSGARATRISGAMLVLSVAGYLFNSDTVLRNVLPALLPAIALLAMIVPYCLWAFARAIFEAPWPRPWVTSIFVSVGMVVWGAFVAAGSLDPALVSFADTVMHIVSLVIVLHALLFTVRGRPDDLVERRRTLRLFFVVVVAAQVLVVLIVELALGTATLPGWLPMSNVIIIALMTVGLAVQILQLNSGFFEPEEKIAAPLPAPGGISLSTADEVLRQKLLDSMDAGYYRQTGLTIRQLADKLRYPEHQLRRLINGHLRYRNFSAFLNSYRIGEARAKLVDPESVRLPVLTIALDLGYASLGPFNRAFKAMTGMTPSEYRQSAAGRISANSE